MRTSTNSRFSGFRRAISTLCVLLAAGLPSVSAVSFADIQLGGFISQGYVQSWGNNQPFEAKGGTFDYREYAVNASYASGNYRVGAQVFGQSLGNYGEDRPILDWAILDYQFNRSFGVRVGRVKFPKGLYGEALDVDAIRPFALLPSSIYNPVLRDFSSSFDGGMIYGNLDLGGAGSVDYKAFYGDIRMDPDQGVADFFNDTSIYAPGGVTDVGIQAVFGTQLMWNTPVIGLRLGYSFNQLKDLYADGPFFAFPAATASLTTDGADYHTLSAEYLYQDWTFAAEAQRFTGDFVITNPFQNSTSSIEWFNWYVSAARRINDRLELGAYYSAQEDRNASPSTPKIDRHNREWVTSARYNITDNLLVKIEGHWIEGTMNVFNTSRTPNPTLARRSTLLVLKSTYSF